MSHTMRVSSAISFKQRSFCPFPCNPPTAIRLALNRLEA